MRRWVKWLIAGVIVVVACIAALAGTGAYFFFRHLETRQTAEAGASPDFETVRERFKNKAPLIEIIDVQKADVRVNRTPDPNGRRATTVHVLSWSDEESRLMKADLPIWLMQFSSINIFSRLGLAPDRYRLTAEDLARYGPGIVLDFKQPGKVRALVWVE